jgi:hypothetical protein
MKYFKTIDKFNLIAGTLTISFFVPVIILLIKDLIINGSNLL